MSWFIARSPANQIQSIHDDNGLEGAYRLIDKGWTIYRIEPAANERFTLIPQQLAGAVTASVTTGGTLEDAP